MPARGRASPSRIAAASALIAATLGAAAPTGAQPPCGSPAQAEAMARLPNGTGEVSGLVASQRYRGVGWMIRDSGHPSSLYSLRLAGGRPRVREVTVKGADNTDWEDLSYSIGPDGRGRLWIVESTQSREAPFIYEVIEPDPDRATRVRLIRRYRYRYPDHRFQNTEASFVIEGRLYLATKTAPTRIYRFDRLSPGVVNRPDYVGELRGANRVSVVRVGPDRSILITSNHETITVYRGKGPGSYVSDFTSRPPASRKVVAPGDNIEGGDYFPSGSCDVVMLSERRNIYRLPAR